MAAQLILICLFFPPLILENLDLLGHFLDVLLIHRQHKIQRRLLLGLSFLDQHKSLLNLLRINIALSRKEPDDDRAIK